MFGIGRFRSSPKKAQRRKVIGRKRPLKLKEVRAIRMRLQLDGCDLVSSRVQNVSHSGQAASQAIIMQQKTRRPVQFEITERNRVSLAAWIHDRKLKPGD